MASPTGGSGGVVLYQWQELLGSIWTDISGAMFANYDATLLTATKQFRRNAKRSLCGSWISSNPVTVTILSSPVADAGVDQSLDCFTSTANIGTAEVIGNSYSWLPILTLSDALSAQPFASPLVTTAYTVTVTSSDGCSSTDEVTLTVIPPSSNTTTTNQCNLYVWPVTGTTYTSTGVYTEQIGCNTEILNLTITTGTSSSTDPVAHRGLCHHRTGTSNQWLVDSSLPEPECIGCCFSRGRDSPGPRPDRDVG